MPLIEILLQKCKEELLDEYPELQKEDLQAAFTYAAWLVELERACPVSAPA